MNQKISATETPNTYKVDAEISGEGLVNQCAATDVLIMLERRTKGKYMYGDGDFYRKQISENIIKPLQEKLPSGSRISVRVWANNKLNNEVIPFTDIDNANVSFMQNSDKLERTEDWDTRHFGYPSKEDNGFGKIIINAMRSAKPENRKVVVSYAGHGVYDTRRTQIFKSGWDTNERINFDESITKVWLQAVFSNYEFYSFEEANAKGRTTHKDGTQTFDGDTSLRYTPLGDEFATLGAAPFRMLRGADYFEDLPEAVSSGAYSQQLRTLASMIGSESGELEIKLTDNFVFDTEKTLQPGTQKIMFQDVGLQHPGGANDPEITYDAATGMIKGKNFRVPAVVRGRGTPSITFSYYVKAKSQDTGIDFNEFTPINSLATYFAGMNGGGLQTLPIPQVKIPGAIYTLNRQWADGVTPADKQRQTLLSLIRKDARGTAVVQSKVYKSEQNAAFTAVPVYNEDGVAYEYSVVENGLPDYLGTEMRYNNQTGHSGIKGASAAQEMKAPITVYGYPLPVDFTVRKLWENTPKDQRKPVTVQLQGKVNGQNVNLADLGVKETSVQLTAEHNFAHVFTGLPAFKDGVKISYSVTETQLGGAAVDSNEFQTQYAYAGTFAAITNIKTSEVTVVNERLYNLKVLKRDSDTQNQGKLKAKFELKRVENGAAGKPAKEVAVQNGSGYTLQDSGADGLTISDLAVGTYKLYELEAPEGYQKLDGPITIQIEKDGKAAVTMPQQPPANSAGGAGSGTAAGGAAGTAGAVGGVGTAPAGSGAAGSAAEASGISVEETTYDPDSRTISLIVRNHKTVEIPGQFPLTGGAGFWIFIAVGGVFVLLSLLWMNRSLRPARVRE
ncbi:Cna B-type domain-containing protein [Arcanobacterium hippocoleae]